MEICTWKELGGRENDETEDSLIIDGENADEDDGAIDYDHYYDVIASKIAVHDHSNIS